jgi:hypothetical protein
MRHNGGGRSPTLETIRMIENTIKDNNGKFTKTQVWRVLPRKVMYETYSKAFDYLKESNKITFNSKTVVWIYYPELFSSLLAQAKSD